MLARCFTRQWESLEHWERFEIDDLWSRGMQPRTGMPIFQTPIWSVEHYEPRNDMKYYQRTLILIGVKGA